MKKLGILIAVFGLFALVGVASASTVDTLQPASTITYNEELVVNDTGRFDSVYIGSTEAGVGGVTFFNGTIVNLSVDEDGEDTIPVTFGDSVRIDGEIFRTEVGGDDPIKLSDTIRPQITNTYDLGTETNVFRNVRATSLYGGSATITSTLTVGSSAAITDELTVADYIAVGGGGGLGADGTTIDTDGNIVADGTLTVAGVTSSGAISGTTATFSGDVAASGDINQDLADNGAMKAMAFVPGDCTANGITRQWAHDDTTITCTGSGGSTTLTFGFDINARYWNLTPALVAGDGAVAEVASTVVAGNNAQLTIITYSSAGAATEGGYMITVY